MQNRRSYRTIPRAYDDTIRGTVSSTISVVAATAFVLIMHATAVFIPSEPVGSTPIALSLVCATWVLFAAIYLTWTHLLFTRTSDEEVTRISGVQHHDRPDLADHLVGLGSGGTGTISAALFAMFAALGAALVGQDAPWITPLALVTVASSWLAMVYAFALRYLRLHAAGETITFDIVEAPRFDDFLSMSFLVSCIGALSAGTPRTRASLKAVRTHTALAFVFNAFIVAMTVSLVVGLVAG